LSMVGEAPGVPEAWAPADDVTEPAGPAGGVAVAGDEPQAAATIASAATRPIPGLIRGFMARILPGATRRRIGRLPKHPPAVSGHRRRTAIRAHLEAPGLDVGLRPGRRFSCSAVLVYVS
jgi:hypothetical protein